MALRARFRGLPLCLDKRCSREVAFVIARFDRCRAFTTSSGTLNQMISRRGETRNCTNSQRHSIGRSSPPVAPVGVVDDIMRFYQRCPCYFYLDATQTWLKCCTASRYGLYTTTRARSGKRRKKITRSCFSWLACTGRKSSQQQAAAAAGGSQLLRRSEEEQDGGGGEEGRTRGGYNILKPK